MSAHPVVVIGAGPIGLAAAAHLTEAGTPVLVLERGHSAGSAVAQWNHVRLFSPWSEIVDPAAARLLEPTGWRAPDGSAYATGREWVEKYLVPLAAVLGHGRTLPSLTFRCRDCNSTDCEVMPYEDDRDRVNKKRVIWRPVKE